MIDAIIDLAEICAKELRPLPEETAEKKDIEKILKGFEKAFTAAYKIADKTERQAALAVARTEAKEPVKIMMPFLLVD